MDWPGLLRAYLQRRARPLALILILSSLGLFQGFADGLGRVLTLPPDTLLAKERRARPHLSPARFSNLADPGRLSALNGFAAKAIWAPTNCTDRRNLEPNPHERQVAEPLRRNRRCGYGSIPMQSLTAPRTLSLQPR
jgi:hypothetical protein